MYGPCMAGRVGRPGWQVGSVNIAQGTYNGILTSWDGPMVLGSLLVCPGKIFQIVTSGTILCDPAPHSVSSSSSSSYVVVT